MLKLFVPCASREDLEMFQSDGTLILKAGNFKRNIALPDTLRHYEAAGARQNGDMLEIRFARQEISRTV